MKEMYMPGSKGLSVSMKGSVYSMGQRGFFDEFVPMMHTGLYDADDQGIFEGDLVEAPYWSGGHPIGEVYWADGAFWVRWSIPEIATSLGKIASTIKVIGNRYEIEAQKESKT